MPRIYRWNELNIKNEKITQEVETEEVLEELKRWLKKCKVLFG